VVCYNKALAIKSDLAEAHYNLGTTLQALGKLDEAVASYNKALAINPDYSEAHSNLGLALKDLGQLNEAVVCYNKALAIKPDYADAHNNIANVLQELGKLDEAVASYNKAIAIKPDYAVAHNNLGNALKEIGKVDEAVKKFNKALAIKPDYAEAHSNLGLALQQLGQLDEAVTSYNKALSIKPGFAEAHFNQHATLIDPMDMAPSIESMKKAVNINPFNISYRFYLGMMLDYLGRSQEATPHFDMIEATDIANCAYLDAWNYIKSYNNPLLPITGSSIEAFKIGMKAAVDEGLVLEFGVRFGTSIRLISELVEQEVHGFDSFEGLPETWNQNPKGAYSTKGVIPSVPDNVILHNGWFEETLPNFIDQHQAPIRFMNIDCDIFSSTKTIFDLLAKQIRTGTVIVFDEYIGNYNWREDEFRAFQEAVLSNGWEYEYLCFSFMTKQVVVRIS
jgi:tetratricopeptide (TPR) repeat protein